MDIVSNTQKNTRPIIWMLDQEMKKITNLAYGCRSNKYGLKIYRHCHIDISINGKHMKAPTTIICQ